MQCYTWNASHKKGSNFFQSLPDLRSLHMEVSDPYADITSSHSDEESSSSSESSDNGGLTDEQIESTIRLLTQVVETSPNDYQSRIQLVGLLRQQGDIEEANSHREILASLFPLGESALHCLLSL